MPVQRPLLGVVLLSVVAAAASCSLVLGFQPAELISPDAGNGGSSSSSATSSSTASSTTTATSSTGTGGTGGSANCTDGKQDGAETDVDCGGGACSPCQIGQKCGVGSDCVTGVCQGDKCVDFVAWLDRVGGMSGTDTANLAGVGLDGTGDAVLAANFTGKASFGGSAVYDTGSTSAHGFAFARFNPLGNHVWDSGYVSGGQFQDQDAMWLAASANGSFVALGTYESSGINFGNGVTLPGVAPASLDAFAVSFNASNVATSAEKYGNASGISALAFGGIATDAVSGGLVAVGAGSWGAYDLPTASQSTVAIQNGDMFVVDVGTNWGLTWNDGGGSSDGFAGVALAPTGDVVAAGHHLGTVNFGGGPRNSATLGQGFVVQFGQPGVYKWDKSFAASPDGLAVDASGNVLVCGTFSGSLDFGLGPLTTTAPGAIFVAKLTPAGTPVWNKAFDVTGVMAIVKTIVAVDPKGNVLLASYTPGGMVNFGGPTLMGSIAVAKLSASGSYLWSQAFGVGKLDRPVGLAAYDDTHFLLGGNFAGSLQIGQQVVSAIGGTDVFLAKFQLQ